jgi:hypothetical protein
MSRPEAEALVLDLEGKMCARLYRRADGTVLTEDCPVGVRHAKVIIYGTLYVAAAAVFLLFALLAGKATNKKSDTMAALRRIEPFATIINWLAPTPPPPPPPATAPGWTGGVVDFD